MRNAEIVGIQISYFAEQRGNKINEIRSYPGTPPTLKAKQSVFSVHILNLYLFSGDSIY